MAEYYYIDANGNQQGPIPQQSLPAVGITGNTLVWTEGMTDWMPASRVPQLSYLFASQGPTPPPPGGYPGVNPGVNPGGYPVNPGLQKPQTYFWLSIATTILCCLPAGIVAIVYSSKVDSSWARGDYQGAVENSDKAKMWGIISAAVGFIASIIAFIAGLAG